LSILPNQGISFYALQKAAAHAVLNIQLKLFLPFKNYQLSSTEITE